MHDHSPAVFAVTNDVLINNSGTNPSKLAPCGCADAQLKLPTRNTGVSVNVFFGSSVVIRSRKYPSPDLTGMCTVSVCTGFLPSESRADLKYASSLRREDCREEGREVNDSCVVGVTSMPGNFEPPSRPPICQPLRIHQGHLSSLRQSTHKSAVRYPLLWRNTRLPLGSGWFP